ncbi:cellulase family glycosylhydrolase [Streptomyces litchfieldiae]|uniref:Cellulase family glycosylhydrolase n=1 Tax=Streptomyces litchfieldiae TaxID=3075543 RepID=A0ABU2N0M5_9ACTN|nr:cellulase family glycosylhydrolase [Streptomyces sp. DSM 44938]MDT0347430.1 cellulase family glycosylhydrolase [Streptomyces sp. DSM 44938]
MKQRKRRLLTALAAFFLGLAVLLTTALSGAAADGKGRGRPHQQSAAQEIVAAMQPGWNVGNTLDAIPDETSWGNPRITPELLAAVHDQGFNSIRLPVTWNDHQGGAPGYTIDPAYLDRVEQVVNMALDEGLYVLLNVHHDSWQWIRDMPTQHDQVMARYTATWTQIAERFRDAPPELLLESVNEPQFTGSSGEAQEFELLDELNTTFHSIVRGTGGTNATRVLVLPSLHTNAEQARLDPLADTIAALNDPNIAATVHYYGFWPFSVNVAGYTRFDAETQADITGSFDRVHNTFVSRGIPVIVGEYGLLGWDRSLDVVEHGEALKFLEFFGSYARQKQLTTMWWDNGQHFNRTTHQWSDLSLFRQIQSSWTTDSATASSDQIFVRAGQAPADATLTLDLNGNTLTSVLNGSEKLVRGRDYTVSGDQLTIAAATLARLTEGQGHGVNATLTLRFNGGLPWHVNVITYDTPVLHNANGTTSGLTIPTAFNGDRLATMEAVYADGTNAGPQNWTSYKEFGYTLSPDYAAGQITLKPEFFAETRDNSTINLTFHFWSGETVTYTLTRTGTTITGTTT